MNDALNRYLLNESANKDAIYGGQVTLSAEQRVSSPNIHVIPIILTVQH